jgi:hypothetical protein
MMAVAAFGLLTVLLVLAGMGCWRERRRVGSLMRFLAAALMFTLAALCATIGLSIRGYRAFTHEVVAATIRIEPTGPQQFRATVTLPDGRLHMLDLSGDAVYMDAHILKWRPLANLLGLHTAYELDRVAGRYAALRDEQTRDHTVHSIARSKPLDLFELARRSRILSPLVDAEYGSATFIGASRPATFTVSVSTSGLLIRQVADGSRR